MASDIRFRCQHCSQHMIVDASGAGLTVECPSCHTTIAVPVPKPTGTRLIYFIQDAAVVAERGGNTFIHKTRNKLQELASLAGPDEAVLIKRAVEWLESRIEANEDAQDALRPKAEATPVPNPELAEALKQLASSLRERWGITDKMLQRRKPRTLNYRQRREIADAEFFETHPGVTHASLPPTEKQMEFLQFLGVEIPNTFTRDQASMLLDELVNRQDLRDRVNAWYAR